MSLPCFPPRPCPPSPALCSGGTRRQPELSLLQPLAEGHSALNALPAESAGPAPTVSGGLAAQGGSRLGRPSAAAAPPAAAAAVEQPAAAAAADQQAVAAGTAGGAVSAVGAGSGRPADGTSLARSDSGSGLPLLLLSPPISMPPCSLLPLPPLSVTSGGAPSGGVQLAAAGGAASEEEAERLLQLHFRPSSSKLSEMFKCIEEQQQGFAAAGACAGGSPPLQHPQQAAKPERSPRTAAELRAALLRLAQQSPPQQAQHAQHASAAAPLLAPHLGLPLAGLAAGGLAPPAAAAAMLQQEHPGLSLLDWEALEALARPAAAQHRWEPVTLGLGQGFSCLPPGFRLHALRAPAVAVLPIAFQKHVYLPARLPVNSRLALTPQQLACWAAWLSYRQHQNLVLAALQAGALAGSVGAACLAACGALHC